MTDFFAALVLLSDYQTILAVMAGSIIGIVFGALPGLTFTMALALVLPLTFGMTPAAAIGMLLSTYIGGMTGGSIPAILLGIPGTPSSAATMFDGYAMTRRGQAGLALGMAVMGSAIGSIFSLLIMVIAVDFVARMAIHFGPVELFSLVVFGLSLICGLAEKSFLRGLIAGIIGLMLMTIGLDDIEGVPRLTFGFTPLLQGVNLVVAMVGLFAVPHIVSALVDYKLNRSEIPRTVDIRAQFPKWSYLWKNKGMLFRVSTLGTVIGAIPGTGGPIAAFLAYDQAKRFSKVTSGPEFGKGQPVGILAPEAANNAVTGGALILLLALGIPGDPSTAVMLGGLMIHGIAPGPLLFIERLDLIYFIYLCVFFATIVVVIFQMFGIRVFVKLLRIPPQFMLIGIMVLCVVGTFAIRNSFLDVYTMVAVGLLGYLLLLAKIPIAPVILGLVLGPTLEKQFRTAMILSENDYMVFFQSPVALAFYGLTIVLLSAHFFMQRRAELQQTKIQPQVQVE